MAMKQKHLGVNLDIQNLFLNFVLKMEGEIDMNYDERMELEKKKKKKKQTIFLIFAIIFLCCAGLLGSWLQNKGDKKSFEENAYQTLKSVNDDYKNDKLFATELSDKIYTFPDKTIVNFNRTILKGGSITRYANGEVELVLYNNKWCALKARGDVRITVQKYNVGSCKVEK